MNRTYAPHETTYQAPRWATQPQIDRIKATLTDNELYDGHFDRLWKLLEVHEIDVRAPGDGTRMPAEQASATITWLTTAGYQPNYATGTERTPFPKVPAGHYAVTTLAGSNAVDFFRVDVPAQGKWAGCSFVTRVIGGHPDTKIRGAESKRALQAIEAEGVEASRDRYADEIGNCWKCNIHLTDDLSRALRIGPDCCKAVYGMTQERRAAGLSVAK